MFVTVAKFCTQTAQKTILITGCNEGIGFQTAFALAAKNHKIIMIDKEDLTCSKEKIIQETGNQDISTKCVDFTSLTSIRNFCQNLKTEEKSLDVLINNVGVFCLGKDRTDDGLHATMQVNHFAPFLLTHLLIDLLAKSASSRVLFVSSLGAFFHKLTPDNINNPDVASCDTLSSLLVYYNSKLCNIITANGFAAKLKKHKISVNSLHPGMTGTNFLWKKLSSNPFKFILQDPAKGAQNSIFLSTSKIIEGKSGQFFVDLKEHQQPRITTDTKFCDDIWACSEDFVELKLSERLEKC